MIVVTVILQIRKEMEICFSEYRRKEFVVLKIWNIYLYEKHIYIWYIKFNFFYVCINKLISMQNIVDTKNLFIVATIVFRSIVSGTTKYHCYYNKYYIYIDNIFKK